MANNNGSKPKPQVYTQVRTFYSDGVSCLNISFYNANIHFKFLPIKHKDPQTGRSQYDKDLAQSISVNFQNAFALYQVSKDIIDGKIQECNFNLKETYDATVTFERKMGQSGQMETSLTLSRNNQTIPFIFEVMTSQVKINGKPQVKVVESGLGSFMKTLEGYLTGINSDRHLDKWTDAWTKYQQEQGQGQQGDGFPQQQQQQWGGQHQGGGYRKNYNGYRKPYGGGNQGGNGNWQPRNNRNQSPPPQQQGMSGYQLPN